MTPGNAPIDWPTWLASVNLFQVAVVIIALYVLIRLLVKFWPWLRKLMKFVDAQAQLPDFIARTDKAISEIHHEVHYNNGSSIKDAQRRTENAVERVELGVKGFYTRMDAVDTRLDGLDQISATLRVDLENTQPKLAIEQLRKENHE